MAKMVSLNIMIPDDYDDIGEMYALERDLAELNRLVCQPVILTEYTRGGSYYSNGTLVSIDLYYDAWYFPNGQLFIAAPGEDTSIYYPNGIAMAYHWMHGDQELYWPNGYSYFRRWIFFRSFQCTWRYRSRCNRIGV